MDSDSLGFGRDGPLIFPSRERQGPLDLASQIVSEAICVRTMAAGVRAVSMVEKGWLSRSCAVSAQHGRALERTLDLNLLPGEGSVTRDRYLNLRHEIVLL